MIQKVTLKQRAQELNAEVYALYLSYRSNNVKWYVRLLLAIVVGYALSPIDLIPDYRAVFGFLDDIVVVATGAGISYSLLSKDILNKSRLQAYEELHVRDKATAFAYKIIGYTWLIVAALLLLIVYKLLNVTAL